MSVESVIESYHALRRKAAEVSDDPEADKVLRSQLATEAAGLLEQTQENEDVTRWQQGLIASVIVNRPRMGRTSVEEVAKDARLNSKTIYERASMVSFYGISWVYETMLDLAKGDNPDKIWFTTYRDAHWKFKTNVLDENGIDLGLKDALMALETCKGLSVNAARVEMSGKAGAKRTVVFEHRAKVMRVDQNAGWVVLHIGDAVQKVNAGDEFELKAWINAPVQSIIKDKTHD